PASRRQPEAVDEDDRRYGSLGGHGLLLCCRAQCGSTVTLTGPVFRGNGVTERLDGLDHQACSSRVRVAPSRPWPAHWSREHPTRRQRLSSISIIRACSSPSSPAETRLLPRGCERLSGRSS